MPRVAVLSHGTVNCYRKHGCRCYRCVEAMREYWRENYRKRKRDEDQRQKDRERAHRHYHSNIEENRAKRRAYYHEVEKPRDTYTGRTE